MFGAYRYLLASMVVIAHLWPSLTFWTGVYAVFSFYLLSGFLMCMVLDRSYGFTVAGIGRFLLNRALRVYPPYLIVVALTTVLLFSFAKFASTFNILVRLPLSLEGWLKNIFIFGLSGPITDARLVPPSWSLDVEISFYVAMAVLLARNRVTTIVWFVASLAYTIFLVASGAEWGDRYAPMQAASLPFSLGALLHYYRDFVPRLNRVQIGIAVLVFGANAATARLVWLSPMHAVPFYLSLLMTLIVVASLMGVDRSNVPTWLARLDDRLGDLSYPIFLCHWIVSGMVVNFLFDRTKPAEPTLFLISFLFANGLALGINLMVEKPVGALRGRIRRAAIARAERSETTA